MRILILFSQPWKTGGAETHVAALIQGLAGHAVFLAVNVGSDEAKLADLQVVYPHLRIVTIQARGANVLRWRRDWMRLKALVASEKIEIVAAQQRTAGIWAYFLHRSSRVPFTVTMHDPWHRAKFKTMYAKMFSRMFVVSRNLSDRLQTDFSFAANQITVIDNGIDFSAFAPQAAKSARAALGLPAQEKILLHVSRLSRVKGAVALQIIAGMAELVQRGTADRLVIIGEGPLYGKIAEQARRFNARWGEHIELRGFTNQIVDWYNAADVLIGEGRVALETLACQRPVVAIRNAERFIGAVTKGNLSYACDVNFDGQDLPVQPERLAEEVRKAIAVSREERSAMAAYIRQRLSVEKMTESYLQVFDALVSERESAV